MRIFRVSLLVKKLILLPLFAWTVCTASYGEERVVTEEDIKATIREGLKEGERRSKDNTKVGDRGMDLSGSSGPSLQSKPSTSQRAELLKLLVDKKLKEKEKDDNWLLDGVSELSKGRGDSDGLVLTLESAESGDDPLGLDEEAILESEGDFGGEALGGKSKEIDAPQVPESADLPLANNKESVPVTPTPQVELVLPGKDVLQISGGEELLKLDIKGIGLNGNSIGFSGAKPGNAKGGMLASPELQNSLTAIGRESGMSMNNPFLKASELTTLPKFDSPIKVADNLPNLSDVLSPSTGLIPKGNSSQFIALPKDNQSFISDQKQLSMQQLRYNKSKEKQKKYFPNMRNF